MAALYNIFINYSNLFKQKGQNPCFPSDSLIKNDHLVRDALTLL